MKNKIYVFAIILFGCNTIFGQTSAWQWAKSAGGTADEYGWGICNDANGNVFATGHFYSATINFGNITLTNINTNGSDDFFVVKYDTSGNVIWAKSAGGSSNDGGQRIAADAKGNVFVIGDFNSAEIIFGHDTLVKTFGKNIFVVKYNAAGNVVWAKSAGGISESNYGQGISIDANDNVYITGAFETHATNFGSHILTNTNSYGGDDIFITKYDSSGNVIWAQSAGGIFDDWCDAICTDSKGNLYVAGYFLSPEIFFGKSTLMNVGGGDIFLVKYDTSGNVVWSKSGRGVSGVYGERISTDAADNIYVTGAFESSKLIFDSVKLTNLGRATADVFLTKYNSSGKLLWAKNLGGSKNDEAFGIANDANDNVYITGYFSSSFIEVGNDTLTNSGVAGDVFIIKYDHEGNVVWSKKTGGELDENGLCIAAYNNNLYLAGDFESKIISFDDQTLANIGNNYNFFLAKLKNQ